MKTSPINRFPLPIKVGTVPDFHPPERAANVSCAGDDVSLPPQLVLGGCLGIDRALQKAWLADTKARSETGR